MESRTKPIPSHIHANQVHFNIGSLVYQNYSNPQLQMQRYLLLRLQDSTNRLTTLATALRSLATLSGQCQTLKALERAAHTQNYTVASRDMPLLL